MSFNLQLFLLFLKTTLRYGLLGFTLSMFLDILIIIFLYSSLHNRHLMSQARRTRHFERSAQKEGRRKIKRLLQVHFSGSSAHLRPQVLTNGDDVKRTNENTIYYSKIVTFLATEKHRQQHKTTGITTTTAKLTFNYVRLSAAKVRFVQSV